MCVSSLGSDDTGRTDSEDTIYAALTQIGVFAQCVSAQAIQPVDLLLFALDVGMVCGEFMKCGQQIDVLRETHFGVASGLGERPVGMHLRCCFLPRGVSDVQMFVHAATLQQPVDE